MPLFQLCQNAGRRKPTQLKLSRNRHVRDYSREVGQHPVTARHANLTRTPISCSRQKDRMATTRQTGLLPSNGQRGAVSGTRNGIRVRCWQGRSRQSRPRLIWCLCARFRVWLRFLAISDLVAVG